MIMRTTSPILILPVVLVLLAGCGTTQPSKFYLLSGDISSAGMPAADSAPVLGIGPVQLAGYLERPQIVQRVGPNELRINESHRWAEPLKENISRVLAANLSAAIPTEEVVLFPWTRDTRIDYQVILSILRLDADVGGAVILEANWQVLQAENETPVAANRSVHSEAAGSAAYDAIVAAQSRALGQLSREIATAIQTAAGISGE